MPQDRTVQAVGNNAPVLESQLDHNALTNLTVGDVHTQLAFLAGRAGGQDLFGGTAATEELELSGSTDTDLGIIRIKSPVRIDSMVGAPSAVVFDYAPTRTFSSGNFVDTLVRGIPDYTVSVAITIYSFFADQGRFTTTVAPNGTFDEVLSYSVASILASNSATIRGLNPVGFAFGPRIENDGLGASWVGVDNTTGLRFAPVLAGLLVNDKAPVGDMTAVVVAPLWDVPGAGSNADFGIIRGLHLQEPAVVLFGSSTGTRHIDNYYGVHMEDITSVAVQGAGRQITVLSDLVAASANLFLKNAGGARSELEGVMAFVAGATAGRIRIEQDGVGISFGASDDVEILWNGSNNRLEFNPAVGTTAEFAFSTTVTTLRSASPTPFHLRYSHIGFGETAPADTDPAAVTFAKFAENMPAAGVWAEARFLDSNAIDLNGVSATLLDTLLIGPSSITVNGGSVADHSVIRVQGMGTTATRNQGIWCRDARLRLEGIFNLNHATIAQFTADQNNFVIPVDGAGRTILRMSTNASRTLSGMIKEQNGDTIWITNQGNFNLLLGHDDTNSSAPNRFLSPTQSAITLGADQSALLWYDDAINRWIILFHSGT